MGTKVSKWDSCLIGGGGGDSGIGQEELWDCLLARGTETHCKQEGMAGTHETELPTPSPLLRPLLPGTSLTLHHLNDTGRYLEIQLLSRSSSPPVGMCQPVSAVLGMRQHCGYVWLLSVRVVS